MAEEEHDDGMNASLLPRVGNLEAVNLPAISSVSFDFPLAFELKLLLPAISFSSAVSFDFPPYL